MAKKKQEIDGAKKPFDKKKWREQKYSLKHKVHRWQEKRRQIVEKQYRNELRKSGLETDHKTQRAKDQQPRLSRLRQAELEYQHNKEQQKIKKEEAKRTREEKLKKIKLYKEKKAERFKKLSQKTKKGQPVMRGRLEVLQEKIEKLMNAIKKP